jgi:hypothetical protein
LKDPFKGYATGVPKLIQKLPEGPLDLIGDIHGELAALDRLLARLGCDPDAGVAERPLVFVGDLVDRGPDSPGVVRRVRQLVEAGLGWCVAGNHELNLLQLDEKEGNGWFLGHPDAYPWQGDAGVERRAFPSAACVDAAERKSLISFLNSFPVVLAREDLRIVHACWDPRALAKLPERGEIGPVAQGFQETLRRGLQESGHHLLAVQERAQFADLLDPSIKPDVPLPGMLALSLAEQAGNPVKVLTSGTEEAIDIADTFFIGGKWRVVQRSRWWERYADDAAVVVGHYWRRRAEPDPGKHDLWDAVSPFGWAGPKRNVFCVDYSVGRRFLERWRGRRSFAGGLAALRWPERTLVFDDRDLVQPTQGFGG